VFCCSILKTQWSFTYIGTPVPHRGKNYFLLSKYKPVIDKIFLINKKKIQAHSSVFSCNTYFIFVNLIQWEFSNTYGLRSQRPQSAANIRNIIKQYKNGNNEEIHFKYDVSKQGQAKLDSQRNVKSVKQMVAVKPEKILIFEGNNKER
jgi:hypothetical protein